LMDQTKFSSAPAEQKKELILAEIVPLNAGNRAMNFGFRGSAGGASEEN